MIYKIFNVRVRKLAKTKKEYMPYIHNLKWQEAPNRNAKNVDK